MMANKNHRAIYHQEMIMMVSVEKITEKIIFSINRDQLDPRIDKWNHKNEIET